MKKLVALLLAVTLMLGVMSALAEYDTHIQFTINSTHSNASMDYNSDGLYKYISEKFNFDYEVYPVSKDSQSEKIRTWINGGTMPDMVSWRNFDYQEYATYAEQGLLKELPKGWEEKYPNLYQMIQYSGLYEKMHIDGEVYGIPHATYGRFSGMKTVMTNQSIYYRKDWVKELGLEPFGDVVTVAQLEEYITKAIEKDLVGNGNTRGFTTSPDYLVMFVMPLFGVDYDGFMKTENGYEWGFANEGTLEGILFANDWLERGILDPDFYLNSSSDVTNYFTSGTAAAMLHNGAISSVYGYKQSFASATGLDANECIGVAAFAADDGEVRTEEALNYWSCTFFSPNIDEAVFERLLEIIDWTCTEEGQITCVVGVPGETWEFDENHNVKMLIEKNEDGNYPNIVDIYNSYNIFRSFGILPDDFSFINPSNDPVVIEEVTKAFAAKSNGKYVPLDFDYEFFASDAKSEYSMELDAQVASFVLLDPSETEDKWLKFIDENKGIWQPVLDDLNAEFFAK